MKDHRDHMRPGSPRPEYQLYPHKTRERDRYDPAATQEVGCQYDIRQENLICTCRNTKLRRAQVGYFGLPKQIYAYHGTRSFTDIGVGSIKTLMRKKVKRIYLPETDDRGVGSSDLCSVIIRKPKQREASYYGHKKTSSKCVGGIIEYNTGCVLSKKLSPIIQTRSGATSPIEPSLNKNQEIGSSTVIHTVITKTTQVDTEVNDKGTVHNSIPKETSHNSSIKAGLKVAKQSKDRRPKIVNAIKTIEAKPKEAASSSDSLEQHVHNLEASSEEKFSHTSIDPMENKLEQEYRRIFSTKSKDEKLSQEVTLIKAEKPRSGKTNSDIKSPSILKRRFEALRRGLVKKEDSKRSASLVRKTSSQISTVSHKDVSIASDPPSLESRSYSNTKPFGPYTSIVGRDRIYDQSATYHDSVSSGKEKGSIQWSRNDCEESDAQGVKGMFKLWGKKFNLEEDINYCKPGPTPKPSIGISKKSVITPEVPKTPPKDLDDKKEGRKFFFFKKKSKDKTKPYKPKKGVTTGRCEVKDGLMIKIGGAVQPEIIQEPIPEIIDDYDGIVRKAWLNKYLSQAIESRNSVKIRWNNKTYATSSSTVFELMDNVYKDAGVMLKSRSEMTIAESPYYQSFTRQQVNFVYQNIEAWMMPKTIQDKPHDLPVQINFKSSEEEKDNLEIRISDQKWFIDKSKAFSHQIEVVLHSKNFIQKKQSSEYLRIDIPKGFFVDSSSYEKRNHSSDEQVYNIVEYETGSEIKKNGTHEGLSTGDNAYNNIEVTVNVKTSKELESVLETVIKTPAMHRDVVIQGSNVYIPKRCDVIGVGIITQKDLKEIKKPILKIRDDVSDEESENLTSTNHKKSEFAESYLQDYYRHWTPLGIDFYSWCISDSHLQCCSDYSKSTFINLVEGSRSCPNIIDDFRQAAVVSSCDTSSCSHFVAYIDETTKTNENFSSKLYSTLMHKKDPNRILPKDSVEVFKRRKLYALSNKGKWASCADEEPYSVPSNESRGAQNTVMDCTKYKKPCCKSSETKPKKAPCRKHVSMPVCDAMTKSVDKVASDNIQGIIAFKGSTGCATCNPNPKNVVINSDCVTEIPHPACKSSCEKLKKPPCSKVSPKRSPLGAQPCNPSCPLNPPSPRCSPTKKPSPPAKTCTPIMKEPCPTPARKPCPPQSPPVVKLCPAAKKPCPTKIPSPVRRKACSQKCDTPNKLSPTGSGSNPCRAGGSPLGSPGNPSPIGSRSSPCKARLSPLSSPCGPSPTGSGSSPCKSRFSPAGSAPCSPAQRASPTKKCCKSGESSPQQNKQCLSPPRKNTCPKKQASPKSCSCPPSPPKVLKPCCSPHCKGVKPEQKSSWCPICMNQSGSAHSLPRPHEVTPGNTPCPSDCNTQKKTGLIPNCAKLFKNLYKKSSKHDTSPCQPPPCPPPPCAPPPCPPTPCPPPTCQQKDLQMKKTCAPCSGCHSNDQGFPWPMKNQLSNQSLLSKCQSAPNKNVQNCAGNSPRVSAQSMIRIEGLGCCHNQVSHASNTHKHGSPCVVTKLPCCATPHKKVASPPRCRPQPTKSQPISGIQLQTKQCKKHSTEDTRKCQDYGCIRLSSTENLSIRLKAQTPSTEEIRDIGQGVIIKVKDDDGQTLYERRDYRTQCVSGQHRTSLLGDMYRTTNVVNSLHRTSTKVIGEAMTANKSDFTANKSDNNIKVKSDGSLTNTIEIQFRMKVTQGDKTTEIGVANDDDVKAEKKTLKKPEEVFVVRNESVHPIVKTDISEDPKNDINIRIVIKNFKSKSDKKKPKCYHDEFSREISDKFHTVSTGYSDDLFYANADNVFSVHRATIDLTTSGNKSKTDGVLSGDVKALTDTKSIDILKSACSTNHKGNVEETERTVISQIYQHCSHKDVTKELNLIVKRDTSEVDQTTVDLTTTGYKSKTNGFVSADFKAFIHTEPIDISKSHYSMNNKGNVKEPEGPVISQIYQHCSDKDVTKELNLTVERDPTQIDFLKRITTDNDITDNDDTERSDAQKPSDFTKRNYLSDKYDYTDIDTEKDDYTEKEELTERDLTEKDDLTDRNDLTDMTEKDDLTGGDELTEKDDFTEKDDLTEKDEFTEKEDLTHTDDDAKRIANERASMHKTFEVKYQQESVRKSFQQNYEAPISTDTDDQDLVLEANTSTDNDTTGSMEVIIKPHTRDEKKEMLKEVFELAHATKVKSKTRMKKLRDMLKSILTSDSSGHDVLKVNELAKDLTYSSLKPNYFRDSDSMNNYYNCEPSDKDGAIRPVVYPTAEKNSKYSKSSGVVSSEEDLTPKECLCNKLATRLNIPKVAGGGCCCCKSKKKDEEIACDLRSDDDLFDNKTNFADVQTQYSKCFNKNNISVHSYRKSSIIETVNIVKLDEVPGISDFRKDRKSVKKAFLPHANHIKECLTNKFNTDTILTISDDDKIVIHGDKDKVNERKYKNDTKTSVIRSSDILQSYEAKKAVLEIYAEKTVTENGNHFIAKLPKFVYDRENEIVMNYEAMAANNYTALCKKNVIMMSVKR